MHTMLPVYALGLFLLLGGVRCDEVVTWTFDRPQDVKTVDCGTKVQFTWANGPPHDVWQVVSQTPLADKCDKTIGDLVGARGNSGDVTVELNQNGYWTFRCDVGTHCVRGMVVVYEVKNCPVVVDWTFDRPQDVKTVDCGTKVQFKWAGGPPHDVWQVVSSAPLADKCDKTIGDLVGARGNSGDVTVELNQNGYWTFRCDVGTHCNRGMVLVYEVKNCPDICFPASSSVHRLASAGTWEAVALPELRIGDTVQCFERQPVFRADGTLTSAPGGQLSTCQVYDYKKAMPSANAQYTFLTYDRPESARPGVLVASPNHHVLNPKSGQATLASAVSAGDDLLVLDDGMVSTAHVLSTKSDMALGAYVPLLTKGGLPIVDGAVVYPSSGTSDVGLDAKHWGQYFLSAPVWQALEAGNAANAGLTLAELGRRDGMQVGAYTQKFYAVAAAAQKEGRTFKNWSGLAAEMSATIKQGKVYSEEEALALYDKYITLPPAAEVDASA